MLKQLVFALLLCVPCAISFGEVVINEILYHAPESDLEYVELYNAGTESAHLGGWILKDGQDTHAFAFPAGTAIPANAYFVLTNDAALFRETYAFDPSLSGIPFHFSNAGDEARLYNAAGQLVESVAYNDRSPWPEEADGLGASLERIHPDMPPSLPASWAASTNKGTPGQVNSTYTEKLLPLIFDVDHTPKIPRPDEAVTVTARIMAVKGRIQAVRLMTGWNEASRYTAVEMADDGAHGDGAASDGVYGATVSGGSAGTILGFYIEADDDTGLTARLPEEGSAQPYLTVVENVLTNERVAIHRVVMLPSVQKNFLQQYTTDNYFPAAFYDGDTVYYRTQIRHRGRSRVQNGRFKVRFAPDQLYRGAMRRLNYNGTDTGTILNEYLSYRLYQDAGLPNVEAELVRLHINGGPAKGTPYRVAVENPDGQFIRRKTYFANDEGNLYKTTLDGTPDNKATWRYVGDDPALYAKCYLKQTNEEEADYSDIIRFCKVLTESNTWDDDYVEKVQSVLNTDDFLRWMAVSACVAHWDSPYTDHGHNYVLYSNPGTGQFHVLAWDLNSTFNYTTNTNDLNNYRKLYTHPRGTKFAAINKILNHPLFGAQYYREIEGLMNTLFSQTAMNQRIEEARLALQMNSSSVSSFKNFVAHRLQDLSKWIGGSQGAAFLSKPAYQVSLGETYLYRAAAVDYRSGQSVSYSLKQAPAWLSADSRTGEVSGVPESEGRFDAVLAATTGKGVQLEQAFSIQVTNPMPRLLMTFNEESGQAMDASEYQNNGTLRGTIRRISGRLGNAFYLDGASAYLEIPADDSLNLTGAVTVEAWINPDFIGNANPLIVTKGDADNFNYTLMLGYGPFSWDGMEPCFMPHRFDIENRVYYGRKEIESRLQAKKWLHIAGTYDSAREIVCVYANNRRIVENANRSLMPENLRPLLIGVGNTQDFRGMVDDVKILPFAKEAFAAGLCLAQIDVSGISPAQDRLALSLSAYRDKSVNTTDYCLQIAPGNRWISLPSQELQPGKTASWWMDELGALEPLPSNGTAALYPISSLGHARAETVLDQVVWGNSKPDRSDAGVRAGVWLPNRSVADTIAAPATIALKNFADNDEMDRDWAVNAQQLEGPILGEFLIDEGAPTTNSRDAQLRILATPSPAPVAMRLSNTPAMAGEWIAWQTNIAWQLSEGEGLKTVYLQATDAMGRRSTVVFARIRLEAATRIMDWRNLE